jgi:hypothetical protein
MLHTVAAGYGTTWAFGIVVNPGAEFETLVLRRAESGWQRVGVPSIGRVNHAAVASEATMWAVGDGQSLRLTDDRWEETPTAPLRGGPAQLFGLAAFDESDVWTAGYAPARHGSRGRGTVQRWDGTGWRELPLPAVAAHWGLAGVGGVSAEDVWAVGDSHEGKGSALAVHWDGARWQQHALPVSGGAKLADVVARASDDVWAAGYRRSAGGTPRRPLVVHWDGAGWSMIDAGSEPGQINALLVDGSTLWGIGYATGTAGLAPYVARFAGSRCEQVPTHELAEQAPNCSLFDAILPDGSLLVIGAASISPNDATPLIATLR